MNNLAHRFDRRRELFVKRPFIERHKYLVLAGGVVCIVAGSVFMPAYKYFHDGLEPEIFRKGKAVRQALADKKMEEAIASGNYTIYTSEEWNTNVDKLIEGKKKNP